MSSGAAALRQAANAVKGGLAGSAPLTRRVRAIRLYRNGLKTLEAWAGCRDIFNLEASKIRARFDAVTEAGHHVDSAAALYALEQGEKELLEMEHPDRYVLPWLPGGTKFMRNAPPPAEVAYEGETIPENAFSGTNTPVHPDMVPIDRREPASGPFLVDAVGKRIL